ncbi:MAG: MaoC family dehydratase N-terminal domain-containing protein [Pseudomonadales bacterium]|nr:MaoC family dehydratase N-terminal domain-containing protein [Pseudomonadales bacterium]
MANSDIKQSGIIEHESRVDERWLMSYMACLADKGIEYYDSEREIVAHPLFPVCFEWPLISELRARSNRHISDGLGVVHASHDLHIHAAILASEKLITSIRVVSVTQKTSGVYETMRIETRDAHGLLLCTTFQGSMYLGEQVDSFQSVGDIAQDSAPAIPEVAELSQYRQYTQSIGPGMAHIYTECSRIWNPIHTDRAVARRAGLPDIILHGTATLALAVTTIVKNELAGNFQAVTRIAARFSAMVLLPSELTIRIEGRDSRGIAFSVLIEARNSPASDAKSKKRQEKVISGGYIGYLLSNG